MLKYTFLILDYEKQMQNSAYLKKKLRQTFDVRINWDGC